MSTYLINDNDENILFHDGNNYDEGSYCQSVLDASTIDDSKHYVLSDVNEWKEDCKRFNDPAEVLMWLGY